MRIRKGVAALLTLLLLLVGVFCAAKAVRFFYQRAYPLEYEQTVRSASEEQSLAPSFVFAVIRTESSFRPDVESSVGARGLMQITEETFQWIQYRMKEESGASFDDLFDGETNIRYGTFLLRMLLDEFGSEANALCAYHAGWGNAQKWLENPEYAPDGKNITKIPFGDTKRYVEKVLDTKKMYEKLYDFSASRP
ncbi:MAG: lytic transglycosylase domain-containing protein [Oscillospiraceae bacterium]|nr:lytic transglycosylase domain-containing protein [Oscillospiraceae bacterium]